MTARAKRGEGTRRRRRERFVVLAMGLFPVLVSVGFFAPGWVRVLATAQEIERPPRGPLADRIGPFAHRPLPAPREFFGGSAPELLDLDRLFAPAGSGGASLDLAQRLASFPRSHSDVIVLDDVGSKPQSIAFKDMLMDPPSSIAKADDDEGILPLCGAIPFGNCVRDDDFTGAGLPIEQGQPIPEPGTAGLVALGLGWLARRRRRS
jgi:nitrate reductase NapE component